MYPLTPMKVYMLERVQDDARCVARMERMLKAVGVRRNEVVCVTEKNVAEVAQELQKLWPPATVPQGRVRPYMRPWVFTTMDLTYKRDFAPLLKSLPPGTPTDIVRKRPGLISMIATSSLLPPRSKTSTRQPGLSPAPSLK